jgi:hypothetical protein
MSGLQPPRVLGDAATLLTEDETRRVRAFVSRCLTDAEACRRLGVSSATLVNLCHRGRMRRDTRDRVFARLDELERGEVTA